MNSGAPFLSWLPLFADASPETLTRFEHRMRRREFASRTEIVREGSTDDSALLTRKPRTASIVALEAATCGIIEQSDFDQLLTEHPVAVRAMMTALADRLDAANSHTGTSAVSVEI